MNKTKADKLKTLLSTLIQDKASPDLISSVKEALERELTNPTTNS